MIGQIPCEGFCRTIYLNLSIPASLLEFSALSNFSMPVLIMDIRHSVVWAGLEGASYWN